MSSRTFETSFERRSRKPTMPVTRNALDAAKFNPSASLPYELRLADFQSAMQDVYDFFFDVNTGLVAKGLDRATGNAARRGNASVASRKYDESRSMPMLL